MKRAEIIVVGSSNTDMTVRSKILPKPGQTILGGEFSQFHGGKGANQATAAARAGAKVTFIAKVGLDSNGESAIKALESDGIRTDLVLRDTQHPSGTALIMVDDRGENLISVAPGANMALLPQDIEDRREVFAGVEVVLLQLEIPLDTVYHTIDLARRSGAKVILNPAPAPGEPIPKEILEKVSILIPNEIELAMMSLHPVRTEAEQVSAARILTEKGVESVVLTRGNKGALMVTSEKSSSIPAFPVTPVDTVAAGDCFVGVFAVGVAEGMPIEEASRFACAAAAISVTRLGAQPSLPNRDEIDSFVKQVTQ